ncbi:MAG TPA: sialidase family protein [Gammaproteobacteria bacterium]|nr:sialidase family protein [Gammaproteobacteria bacterium]
MRGSVLYQNAEVEPFVAVNPANPAHVVGVWQQDRWSDGGAHGLMAAASFDGGKTWAPRALVMSRCAGGNAGNGADYARASDPWVTISPDGAAYAISISFSGVTLQPNSTSSVLVSRSADGGQTWSDPLTLILDGPDAFNDKESIAADPNNENYVYAVWDRLTTANTGAAMLARTADGGASWQPAQVLYDPGANNQTLNNQLAVLPDGSVIAFFTEIDNAFQGTPNAHMAVVRSTDHGATWSAPVKVADIHAVGARDPETGQDIRDGAFLGQIVAGPDGKLFVVWQDARFSGGQRDGVLISQSGDGGLSWSTPVEINGDPAVQAFEPAVAVRGNGTIGVSYYDFRDDTADRATLPTDYWLTQSADGASWKERRIAGPFDFDLAPDAEGLFTGDYQGIVAPDDIGFLPFFVQTTDEGTANRTDVFAFPPRGGSESLGSAVAVRSVMREPLPMSPEFRRRVQSRLLDLLREEIPGRGKPEAPPVQP